MGSYSATCSYIGYKTAETGYYLQSDTIINFTLQGGIITEEVTVASIRASSEIMASTTMTKEEIRQMNTGQDVPYLLQLLPSVIVTSDAGTGIGYTGIRIRGTDQSRINVTLNGIPMNDAESQQVYWVDLPDFSSSVQSIQVQRGAGSSTNGSPSFGGSVNLLTHSTSTEPFAEWTSGYGSFNSFRNTVNFSTGKMKNKFALDGRLSKITSDGYIDRGTADLKSFFLGGSYSDDKNIIRLNVFTGKEITYQSWYGVPEVRYNNDEKGMQDFILHNYFDEEDAANLLNSGRTYNYYTYENQVDNYQQNHYQLHYARTLSAKTTLNTALHYTKGSGYYEEYKKDQELAEYGINPVILTNDTITNSDLIRQRWLNNDFYGVVIGITSQINDQLELAAGGAANRYDGDHFGEVIWARYASDTETGHRYYFNNAVKNDANVYSKFNYTLNKKADIFVDLQYRNVTYDFEGLDPNGTGTPASVEHHFFNPKAGVAIHAGNGKEFYASVAIANKEPNRDDYVISTAESRPKAEHLTDFELGYRYIRNKVRLNINGYYMLYKDQLVLTGAVNDVGNYTRVNIDDSYRAGVELEAGFAITKQIAFDMNLTFSNNRIKDYTEFNDAYVNFEYAGQGSKQYKNSPIALSPELTTMSRLSWKFKENITAMLSGRYVSEQFLDNTGSSERMLDAYLITDFRLEYIQPLKYLKELRFNLLVNNIFSTEYASNGYTYAYYFDGPLISDNYLYPQALINFMGQITFRF